MLPFEIKPLKSGFSFSEVEAFDHGKNTFYVFKNVSKGDIKSKNSINLHGSYMIIAPVAHYFHFLKEYVGSFLYYKNNISSDIKFLWVNVPWEEPEYHKMKSVWDLIKEMLFEFSPDSKSLDIEIIDSFGDIYIENLVLSFDSGQIIVNKSFPNFDQKNNANNKDLVRFLNRFMIEDSTMPSKIFISRKLVSETLKKENKTDSISRYNPEWMENAIEDYFKNNGYAIVELSGLTIQEQIKYFYNANKVAGAMGAGLINGIFSKPGTKFLCLKIHEWFYYPYEDDISQVIDAEYNILNMFNLNSYQEVYDYLEEKASTML